MSKISKKDLDDLYANLHKVIKDENSRLLHDLKGEMDILRKDIDDVKAAQQNINVEFDDAICQEILENEAKKREIYFSGTSKEEILSIIRLILSEEPEIKFARQFKTDSVKGPNGLIGLSNIAQCQAILAKKAEFLNDEKYKHITINNALSNRMARFRKKLRLELNHKRSKDEYGKRSIIRYGKIIQINVDPSTNVSKN